MVTLNLGEIEFDTKADIVNVLNELANAIEYGYNSGIPTLVFAGILMARKNPKKKMMMKKNLLAVALQ